MQKSLMPWYDALMGKMNEKVLWFVVGLMSSAIIAYAVVDTKWVYIGLLSIPCFIYIGFKNPLFFPFGLYVFLLPFESLTVITNTGRGPTVVKYLGLLSIVVLFLKGVVEKRFKRTDSEALFLILFILYAFSSVTWAIDPSLAMGHFTTASGLLLLYLVAVSYRIRENEYRMLRWFIVVSGFLTASLTVYQYFSGGTQGDVRVVMTLGERDTGLNKQGFDLLLPTSAAIAMLLEEKGHVKKLLFLAAIVIILFGIILTGSRGNLYAAVTIILVYFFLAESTKRRFVYAVTLAVVAMIVITLIPEFFVDRIRNSAEDNASGRIDIWIVGLKSLEKYWLTGAGLDNFITAYTEFVEYSPKFIGLDRAPHNIFIGFSVELGILGITLMVMAMAKHYLAIGMQRDQSSLDQSMLHAAFWGILVAGLTLDCFWYKSFWLLWMLILMRRGASQGEKTANGGFATASSY